jgi:indolepyruvate ferredoxin oxidoreductase
MAVLGRLQWLRETPLDIFGRSGERQQERAWRNRYIDFVKGLTASPNSHDLAVAHQIAKIPENVRGFGHVKADAMVAAIRRWDELATSLTKK